MTYDKLLRRPDVQEITGFTRYMIDLLEGVGAFPKRMQVGRRNVFWSESEVVAFVEQAKCNRGGGGGGGGGEPAALNVSHCQTLSNAEVAPNDISC